MDVGDDVPFDFTRSVSSLVGVQEGLRTREQQAETLKKSQHMVPLYRKHTRALRFEISCQLAAFVFQCFVSV